MLDLENMVTGIRNSGTKALNIALVNTGISTVVYLAALK